MIGWTFEITDEVRFGRRDQHLHLCPQMKQVWYSAMLKGFEHAMQSLPHNTESNALTRSAIPAPHVNELILNNVQNFTGNSWRE